MGPLPYRYSLHPSQIRFALSPTPRISGYASSVYKAVCKASSEVVVLKVYTLASVCDLYKFQIYREVFLHSGLKHENVVTLHAAFQEGDKVVMVQVRQGFRGSDFLYSSCLLPALHVLFFHTTLSTGSAPYQPVPTSPSPYTSRRNTRRARTSSPFCSGTVGASRSASQYSWYWTPSCVS